MPNRTLVIQKLLLFDTSLKHLRDLLSQFEWDSDIELAVLQRTHLRSVLERFLLSDLTASDVEEWANLVEGREDIGFEESYEDILKDVLFTLANPDLSGVVSKTFVHQLLRKV